MDDSAVILGNFSKNNSRIQISPSWLHLGNLIIYPLDLGVALENKTKYKLSLLNQTKI